jgi:UDPglucose 6-dehydrogenase
MEIFSAFRCGDLSVPCDLWQYRLSIRQCRDMKICVYGLWHLGCVTAACLAERFPTIGLDLDPENIAALREGKPPIFEPGLTELVGSGISTGRLTFTSDVRAAVSECDFIWVAFDTPVDDEDRADTEYVENQILLLFPHLREGATILISSQLPVGSTRRIEQSFRRVHPTKTVHFAYSPENLRLGKALDVFRKPGRIVVGTRSAASRDLLMPLFTPFCDNLIWMSVESAEMTKHALNAFLANSVVFINEIAGICEDVGADAKQVETGLKTDERIGPRAYLGAGGPFAGGTLARDVAFLTSISSRLRRATPLLDSIRRSNDLHKDWPKHKLLSIMGSVSRKNITVLGLTYKPGTNTLRRSSAIELCQWLCDQGAQVTAYDPMVQELPGDIARCITLAPSVLAAIKDSEAIVVATEWPQFRELSRRDLIQSMKTPVVLDPNRFLEKALQTGSGSLAYFAVGTPKELA